MPNSENVTTKFKVDISDLKSNIAEANRQLKTAQAEMKNATAGMDKSEKTVDSLSAQIAAQSKIVEAEEKKLAALKSEMERYNARIKEGDRVIADLTEKHRKAAAAYGAESAEAKKYEKQLQDAQKAQERNKTAAENLNVQIINQDTKVKEAAASVNRYKTQLTELESGEKKTTEATKDLGDTAKDTTDGGLDAFAVALGNLAANVITAVIDKLGEMAQAAINAFEDFDTGRDAVIKATGAVGEQADLLTKSYGEVAKKVPGDLAAVGETLGEINTRFGFTGSELEDCTEKFIKFADIAGVDAKTSVQTVSKAMAGAGVSAEDYADFLDKIAIAAQASGISADKLTENLTRYGAQMRALGFDTDTSIAAFSQWEKAGVNVETALAGMKKAVGEWSKEGIDAKIAFQETVDQIASAPDDISAAQKAVEAFGGKAGPEFADAIRSGRFEFSDFLQTVENSNGTVENTFNETQSALDRIQLKSQQLRATAGEMIGNLLEKYEPQITALLDKVGSFIDGAVPKIEAFVTKLVENLPVIETDIAAIIAAVVGFKAVTIIQGIIGALGGLVAVIKTVGVQQAITNAIMAANPIGLIIAGIAALIAIIVVAYQKVDWFREFVDKYIFQNIKDFANWWTDIVTNKIPKAFTDFLAWFTAGWSQFANGFRAKLHDLWENIKKGASAVPGFFKEKFTQAYTNIKSVFSGIGSFFGGIWDTIKGKFSDIGTKVGEVVGGAFKTAINAVISTVENGLNFIPNAINGALDLINDLPGVNIPKLLTFQLPRLMAKGGIAQKPVNAIVGEAGAEAVIPLKQGIPQLAAAIASSLQASGVGLSQQTVNNYTYNFDQTNNSPKALSRWEIYRQTKNLLSYVQG